MYKFVNIVGIVREISRGALARVEGINHVYKVARIARIVGGFSVGGPISVSAL